MQTGLATVLEVQYGQPVIKAVHKEKVVLLEREFVREIDRTGRHLDVLVRVDIGKCQPLGPAEYRTPLVD